MLKKSEFARNSVLLVVGTGLSQVIPLAVQPIIRRVFTDEEFGLFAQYYSVVSILSIIASLKYESSVVIAKSDKSALHLLVGSIALNLGVSLVVLLCLFLFGHWFFDQIGFSENLSNYFWMLPISVFVISTNIALNYWLTRKKRFKSLVINKISRKGSEAGVRVGFGFSKFTGGLMYGNIIGDIINLFVSLFQFKKAEGSFKNIKKKEVVKNMKEQSDFPKYALFPAVLNVVSSQLPIFLFAALYSDAIVGQYNGSKEVLSAPLALISISISQVLYQRIVEDVNRGNKVYQLIRNNALILSGLGVLGIAIFFPFGTVIFEFIFGDKWTTAGRISEILVFSYAIKFVVSPLSMAFIALKKLRISAAWQIGYFLLTLNLLWLKDLPIEDFILYIVLFDLIAYTIYGLLIFKIVKNQDRITGLVQEE